MTVPLRFRGGCRITMSGVIFLFNGIRQGMFFHRNRIFLMICVCGVYCSRQETKTKQPSDIEHLTAAFLYIPEAIYCFRPETGLSVRDRYRLSFFSRTSQSRNNKRHDDEGQCRHRTGDGEGDDPAQVDSNRSTVPPPKMEATALAAQKQP